MRIIITDPTQGVRHPGCSAKGATPRVRRPATPRCRTRGHRRAVGAEVVTRTRPDPSRADGTKGNDGTPAAGSDLRNVPSWRRIYRRHDHLGPRLLPVHRPRDVRGLRQGRTLRPAQMGGLRPPLPLHHHAAGRGQAQGLGLVPASVRGRRDSPRRGPGQYRSAGGQHLRAQRHFEELRPRGPASPSVSCCCHSSSG